MNKLCLAITLCGLIVMTGCSKGNNEQVAASASEEMAISAKIKGQNLYVAIVTANTERGASGLPSVWPHSKEQLIDDKDDVAGGLYGNAIDYFKKLFDLQNAGTDKHLPFVEADPSLLKLSPNSKFCDWIVVKGLIDEMDDCIPVLISSNVDPKSLKTKSYDGKDNSPIPFGSAVGRKNFSWADDFVVVVVKGGNAKIFKKGDFTYANLYNKTAFKLPSDVQLEYLDVK